MQVLCGNEDRKSNINNKRRDNLKKKANREHCFSTKKPQLLEWRRQKRLQKWQRVQAVEVVVLFFVCFVLLLAARATKTTMSGQNAAFGRSHRQLTNRGRNRFKTQHQRLATRRPSARCNVTRAVRPREPRTAKRRFVS